MSRISQHDRRGARGPSQRQLRAGELVRHALDEILRHENLQDEALSNVSITVSEVRLSPDLKSAVCFVEPLGGENAAAVVAALNRSARFLRGRLGHAVDLRFTPTLRFVHDESFEAAARMEALLHEPRLQRDLDPADVAPGPKGRR
ncbi:MAG TPA: 30S ribosome-binding factor RbfA [Caulobacteraceae bacterium]|nr:30S ribosome-binding factor RbfA [Caulobacteraceae bacterium]